MEGVNNVACPVCTLFLRPGITLENHLSSHPKQKVIEALIRVSQLQNVDKVTNNEYNNQQTPGMSVFSPINGNLNQIPTNHSFIYQQFMSSTGSQPLLNVNPMNQQFVAVPTVYNPQMVCSPYIFQQQQQVQILSAATNIQPFMPRSSQDLFPFSNPAVCSSSDSELVDPLSTSVHTSNSSIKSSVISVNSSQTSSINDKLVKNVRETNSEKLLTITNFNNNPSSIPEDLEDDDEEEQDRVSTGAHSIIIETNDHDELVSVTINVGKDTIDEEIIPDEKGETKNEKDDDELNKACQTTQAITEKDINNDILNSEPINNASKIVLVTSEPDIFDETEAVHITPDNDFQTIEKVECPSNSTLQNNNSVLDMDFILPNDFIHNSHDIISKTNEVEYINEISHDDRPQVLLNIGEETLNAMNISDDKSVVGVTDFEEEKFVDEKLDEECASRESLNIRADERMPPRGELSEQESNGASDVGWGSRIYQEGSSGMSTSYDLLARESWEASDCSDSELPPLQSRIQPSFEYTPEDVDEAEAESDSKLSSTFNFSCSTCGQAFRCPKERRVHQTKEHTSDSSSVVQKIFKKKTEKADNNLNVLVNDEKMKFELLENGENESEHKPERVELNDARENILCNTCGVLLSSLKEFFLHNKKVHNIVIPNQNLTCKTCKESFISRSKYSEHLKIHPLECHICGKNFHKFPNLRLHLKRHSGVRPHKCDICPKTFFAKQKLREHNNIHTGNSPIKCTMCDETFKRYSNLIQHRNKHHLNVRKKSRDYICHCGEIYPSKSKLNWHKETHEPKPKSCKYCHEKFIHMASLTRHIRRAHNQRYVPEVSRENENVECKICKGVYLKSSLDAHLYTHSGKKKHSCPICNKQFSTKWNLKLHKWTHAAPTSKPFKCESCNSAFIRQSDYISHVNSHRSIRPYTCNYCGCKFIRKYNCARHVREHEEGKSYNCGVCNKSFHRSYYLKEHMRVHTGVRPFSCNICGKTSTTKSNHNKHMKIHHAREPVMTEG